MTPEFEATLRAQAAVIAEYEKAMTPAQRAAFRWGTTPPAERREDNFRQEKP